MLYVIIIWANGAVSLVRPGSSPVSGIGSNVQSVVDGLLAEGISIDNIVVRDYLKDVCKSDEALQKAQIAARKIEADAKAKAEKEAAKAKAKAEAAAKVNATVVEVESGAAVPVTEPVAESIPASVPTSEPVPPATVA